MSADFVATFDTLLASDNCGKPSTSLPICVKCPKLMDYNNEKKYLRLR